jgi:hypothetical protein
MKISQGNSLYSYHIQTKISFLKTRQQEGKTGPVWVAGNSRRGEAVVKDVVGEYRGNITYSCMKIEK